MPFTDIVPTGEHVKCTSMTEPYMGSPGVYRADSKASAYAPIPYTSEKVTEEPTPVWADPDDITKVTAFNQIDRASGGRPVDRRSFEGNYLLDGRGYPQNPIGRTGMTGRGLLGRWGPNHAGDPIVTRWLRNSKGAMVLREGLPVLQMVAVKRRDNGQDALPGGMVDPDETVSATIKREFGEEALGSLDLSTTEKKKVMGQVDALFKGGVVLYRGYVDDPRNTDNAWMETVVSHAHDETGEITRHFDLVGGDDVSSARWVEVSADMDLFASHLDFVRKAAGRLEAAF